MQDTKNCLNCGKDFILTRKDRKYCKRSCKEKHKGIFKYKAIKKSTCDFCGFIPVDKCQLDVDHIDGNHLNNSLDNLQTLCANCHRLKSKLERKKGTH